MQIVCTVNEKNQLTKKIENLDAFKIYIYKDPQARQAL